MCRECESWMGDKENVLNTFQPKSENVEVMQVKYQVRRKEGHPSAGSYTNSYLSLG